MRRHRKGMGAGGGWGGVKLTAFYGLVMLIAGCGGAEVSAPAEVVPVSLHTPPGLVDSISAELYSWGGSDNSVAVAEAVVRESDVVGVNPWLVVAVVRIENPWLKPDTVSYAGAVGIMQVMPRFWSGVFDNCGTALDEIDDNVCVGVRVLNFYLRRESSKALRLGLLAYNGCQGGPCTSYAKKVMDLLVED